MTPFAPKSATVYPTSLFFFAIKSSFQIQTSGSSTPVSVINRWSGGDIAARTGLRGRYGEIGEVGASVDGLLDELDRRRVQTEEAEAARAFLSRELSHRVKNTLSVVQAIARQTFSKIVPPQSVDTFSIRVRALAGAYDTLLAEEWESADIHDVVGMRSRRITSRAIPGSGSTGRRSRWRRGRWWACRWCCTSSRPMPRNTVR